jgi:hypothetical protein
MKKYIIYILFFFFLINLISFLIFFYFNVLIVDLIFVNVKFNIYLALILLIYILISLFFLFYVYFIFSNSISFNNYINTSNYTSVRNILFILLINDLFVLLFFKYGTANLSIKSNVNPFILLSSYLNASYLFLIFYVYYRSYKISYILLILYILINIISGWSASWIYLSLIELYFLFDNNFKKKYIYKYIIYISILLLLSPYLNFLKEKYRGNIKNNILSYQTNIYFLTNRLQIFTNAYLIIYNSNYIKSNLNSNKIHKYYYDLPFFNRYANNDNINKRFLQKFITYNYLSKNLNIWNTSVPLFCWFLVLDNYDILLLFLFIIISIYIPIYINKKYFKSKYLNILIFLFIFFNLYHGWISPYYEFIFSFLFFSFLQKLKY